MTALNFPASPTNGQIYASGNRSWIYNATLGAWEGGAAAIAPAIFTPITLNQYGTHPAFSSQAALNAYLLGNTTTPAAQTITANSSTPS